MACHFISDLHLGPHTPELNEGFTTFLSSIPNTDTLYILGDFFDAWIGDDDNTAEYLEIQNALKRKTDAGLCIFFMRGNRDFSVGKRFAANTGMQLLKDPSVVRIYDEDYLLLHGDSLCTDDKHYMRFRKVIQNPLVIASLMAMPLSWRRKIAASLRDKSQEANTQKRMEIMDVSEGAVALTFSRSGVHKIIHGHTHRPAIHTYDDDKTRVVLGDWNDTGWVFTITGDGTELREFKL